MGATCIGLTTIFTTELSHTQTSDRSIVVTWKQKLPPSASFSLALGAQYTYLGSISVRVTKIVTTKTSGEFKEVEATLEGAGDITASVPPTASQGTQESIGSLSEEPIQTHPYFSLIVGFATTSGVTYDDNNNFVGFNASAQNGLAGVQQYLAPTMSYRRSYTTSVTPNLTNVGRIFAYDALSDFPTITAGANWLLTSISFTSKGGTLNVIEDYRASESSGWNQYIYKEAV